MKRLKIFTFVATSLVTLLLLTAIPRIVFADTVNYSYNISENGIIITGMSGNDSSITIPQEIDGQSVIGISDYAFSDATNLTSIVFPANIVYIGDYAFSNCPKLTSVKFMGDAPSIGLSVFSNSSPALTIYYDPDKNGFSNPWNGFPAQTYSSVPDVSPVTGITLDKASATLILGESLSLVPTISPVDATDKNVIWTSKNPSVAKVDAAGTIMALREGNTIITAITEDGGFIATCSVNVINLPAVPGNELAVPLKHDSVKVLWTTVSDASGYEVYRSKNINGEYIKLAEVQSTEFTDTGLKAGTTYFYKIRACKVINEGTIYSNYTQPITIKTLDLSIGSSLFLYMSDLNNRNSVVSKATVLHNGDPSNTCAITVSEALRRLGIDIPVSTIRTNQVEAQLVARGWKREMNLNLLQPGDICFTTDKYGNLLGGHSTHTFIFMSWANQKKTLMNICDNQISRYGSVLHTRTIFRTSITDATAFFYHTNLPNVGSILKLPSKTDVAPIAYNKVKITWGATTSAYGYKIYRASSKNGTYHNIATTRSTSYIDTSVLTGKTYYYKLRAYNYVENSIIYGSYSDIYSAATSLAAPSALVNTNYSGKTKLSWKAVSGANGYQIDRSTSKNGTFYRLTNTSKTSFTNSSLVRGKTYYYKVRAYRYIGNTKVYSKYSYINIKAL